MDKIQEIVKKIYNKNSTPECTEYKLIKFLRETCNGSQENIVSLKKLMENLMCLAILKGNTNNFVYKTYKKLAYILSIIYSDVGLPPNIIDIFYWPSRFTTGIYTKFPKTEPRFAFKKFRLAEFCSKPIKTKIKITLYTHKNPGKL